MIRRGTPEFRRTNLAIFLVGFATFALLYCVQPILPAFSREFGVSATRSSLALSLTTGLLAFSMLLAGVLSDAWGRKPMLVVCLFVSSCLAIAGAAAPTWTGFLLARALQGLVFGGIPAVAMAYLSEEVESRSIGLAIGLYVGGTAFGGMSGRLFTGFVSDLGSWRVAIVAVGATGIISSILLGKALPPSAKFRSSPLSDGSFKRFFAGMADARLWLLFSEGFLLMGGIVTIFNYLGYRLTEGPYHLTQGAVGSIFLVYIGGMLSSAWAGHLADLFGHRNVLWAAIAVMLAGLLITLASPLVAIVCGVAVMTCGYFAAHSVASSWAGLRARGSKGAAATLYLCSYYLGASFAGTVGGLFWTSHRWAGVCSFVAALLVTALAISLWLAAATERLPFDENRNSFAATSPGV